MTVEEFFDNFLISEVNLNKVCQAECDGSVANCDICKVTGKYKDLAEKLKDKLRILPSDDEETHPSIFLTGSYRRHTMIRPPKDVDFFIVLDSQEYQDSDLNDLISPKKLLDKLQSVLGDIFKDQEVEIEIQQHSVIVIFDETFSIDIIPAFGSDDKKAYRIPDVEGDMEGKYIISNPKIHYETINQINNSTSVNGKKRFKKSVRLLKFIKRKKFNAGKSKIRSFHFELLAAHILGSKKINSYSEAINNFLSEAPNYFDKSSLVDPANSDNMIDDYIDDFDQETKESIKGELNSLYGIAQQAADYEESGNDQDAINEWKKIFDIDDHNNNKSSNGTFPRKTVTINNPPSPWCNV